jgi:RHS repeat-associated protein
MTPGSGSADNYTEDASSNLTTLPTGGSGTYDDASELTSSSLSGTTTDYTYDADGNRTQESAGGSTLASATYNGAVELTGYSNSAADMTAASYDGDGVRASATTTPTGGSSSTQHFVWDENGATPELLMDSTNAYLYGPSGTPFEQVNLSSGTVKYLVSDALGSARGVVSSSGTLSASTSYDAWGNPETTGGLTSSTPFGFAGGYTDPTGLVYLINRSYDPSTGQFLTVDPDVAETGQPYAYTGDDPVNAVDPTGLDTEGYCVDVTLGIGVVNFGAAVCIVEANGNQQVGYTVTAHGSAGISSNAISEYLANHPLSLSGLFTGSVSAVYQTSNANQICQLGGGFDTLGASGIFGPVSASYQHFSASSGISGSDFAIGRGLGAADFSVGKGYEDTVYTRTLSGSAANDIAGIITTLNLANPLHWLAGPLGLY